MRSRDGEATQGGHGLYRMKLLILWITGVLRVNSVQVVGSNLDLRFFLLEDVYTGHYELGVVQNRVRILLNVFHEDVVSICSFYFGSVYNFDVF